jgi:hypothetical protein
VILSHFWALLHTGLTGHGHWSDRSECWSCAHVEHRSDRWCRPVRVELMQLLCFHQVVCMHSSRGVALVLGELACVQGELFVFFELWFGGLRSLLEHSFVSDVSSRCPCLRGPRLVFFWRPSLCLCLAFDHLLKFLFISFVSFSFVSGYYMCVLSIHTSRGRLRTVDG